MSGYSLIRESFPVARKTHRCIWCGERIPVGEKHRHEISRYDMLQDFRFHMECWDDATDYFRDDDQFIPYDHERPTKMTVEELG